ncbi:unnamed protein product [Ixodes pacificus]
MSYRSKISSSAFDPKLMLAAGLSGPFQTLSVHSLPHATASGIPWIALKLMEQSPTPFDQHTLDPTSFHVVHASHVRF